MKSVAMKPVAKMLLAGDVMLGRLVKQAIHRLGPDYPLGEIATMMRRADITLVNLECAITASGRRWSGAPKAFYFGAPPLAVDSLIGAGVDLVTLANNHTLDYDVAGLIDTLRLLKERGIGVAGAGATLAQAQAPAVIERGGITFGLVAYCDHQEDFAAGASRPGIAYLDLSDEEGVLSQIREDLHAMKGQAVDWPIVSLHWGPNMVDHPSPRFVRLAHRIIDAGCGLLFGHSAHLFHGIEIYKGRPIFYSVGDLVNDYAVDPDLRNDRQLLFEVEVSRTALHRIDVSPVFIEDCRTVPATSEDFESIAQRFTRLCTDMGTKTQRKDSRIWIDGKHSCNGQPRTTSQ